MKKAIVRKVHKIDASSKTMGRLATSIALILRGKNKADFQPHLDLGDTVEVSNIDKLKFTGKKLEQKTYYKHSGYPSGIRKTKMGDLNKTNPALILKKAVRSMLPTVKFRDNMLKRLIIK
ncbi:MAG: 50S ribosomal protein L13 [Planctomycetes bacterium]|jgi:large subunit ribosomal protein L13|nr:50S ribosomal protein L13 [Planctomycetota bacterium]